MKKEIKLSFRDRILFFVAEYILPFLIRFLGMTWRVKIYGMENYVRRGALFVFWHEHILPLSYVFRGRGIKVLISESRDGEVIARAVRRLGFGVIRGSSTRGGTKALTRILAELKAGNVVAITPDGPRGPRRKVKPGVALAAVRSGASVVAFWAEAKPCKRLNSWDKFLIPLPFASVTIHIGKPVKYLEENDLDHICAEIENMLNKLGQK